MSVFTNRHGDAKAQASAYTKAVLELVGERDPWAALAATPEALAGAIAGLDEAALRGPEGPGKWSITEVLRHLVDNEFVYGYRLRTIAATDRAPITGYDQDGWAEALHYARDRADELVEEFRMLRQVNLRFLRGLPPGQRRHVGVHSERGEESLDHLVRMTAGHDLLHLRQIERIRKALG